MKDRVASVRARLKSWAAEQGVSFQYASMLYMHEGILARLAFSPYADSLVLKGGFLLFAHAGKAGRTTKDIDFLGQGFSNDEQHLATMIGAIVGIEKDDGLIFNRASIMTERIIEEADYNGVRVSLECRLGSIRNQLKIDIGFGDALSPGPTSLSITRIVEGSTIEVSAYPFTSVIAEKFETMIALGDVNSRMKDLFDVAFILEHYSISNDALRAALYATFDTRRTELPEHPAIFSLSFEESTSVRNLWAGFIKRTNLGPIELTPILTTIKDRLEPIYLELRATMVTRAH